MNYEGRGRNELRGSKQIMRVKTDYKGQNELRNYMSIREIISYLLNIIYTHYKLKKIKKKKINGLFIQIKKKKKINGLFIRIKKKQKKKEN